MVAYKIDHGKKGVVTNFVANITNFLRQNFNMIIVNHLIYVFFFHIIVMYFSFYYFIIDKMLVE